jgi:hypothetical protein
VLRPLELAHGQEDRDRDRVEDPVAGDALVDLTLEGEVLVEAGDGLGERAGLEPVLGQ